MAENIKSTLDATRSELNRETGGMSRTRYDRRRDDVKWRMESISLVLADSDNFLDYSSDSLNLVQEIKSKIEWISVDWPITQPIKDAAKLALDSLIKHLNKVNDAHNNIFEEPKTKIIEIGTTEDVELGNYFDLSTISVANLNIVRPWFVGDKSVDIKDKSWRSIGTRDWSVWWAWERLSFNWDNLKVNLLDIVGEADAIPSWISKDRYPLTVELDLFSDLWWEASIKTLPKIKINIKEPVDFVAVLSEFFTGTETYQDALDTRLDNYYNTNSEKIIKEYILERINKAGWTLSDTQKNILVDHMYNDPSFLNWNSALAYTAANLKTDMPNQVKDDSVWWDNWYRDALRTLLINPDQFNIKSKEVFLDKMREKKGIAWFKLNDDDVNKQVNELIQEQASNSIWNITNWALPALFWNFWNKNNTVIRHKNKHKTWFRGFKKMLWIFKPTKRRKLTDISTNNYFSFMSWTSYNISDEANVAGKKINQNIKLDMNSRNNVSASIKVTWDETADFEFAWASSVYELITWILWNNQVWAVTKTYLVFNIYKQFFQKMQKLFWDQDIAIWGHIYNIQSTDKLIIKQDSNNIFDESQFRNLESATDLQSNMTNLGWYFNLIMWAQNQSFIKGMTTKKQNKFKVWGERVWRVLRKRRNADFKFKTEVEWVNISYEDKKFTVTYEGEEIKANKLETILSHKILEGKQIQIMKAVYKEMINTNAADPKAQKLLEKKSGIGFVIKHNSQEYVVSTQWDKLRFGLIPAWFPRANIDKKTGILKGWMFVSINEDEVLSNPELSSQLIHWLRRYRRKWVRWVDYWV